VVRGSSGRVGDDGGSAVAARLLDGGTASTAVTRLARRRQGRGSAEQRQIFSPIIRVAISCRVEGGLAVAAAVREAVIGRRGAARLLTICEFRPGLESTLNRRYDRYKGIHGDPCLRYGVMLQPGK